MVFHPVDFESKEKYRGTRKIRQPLVALVAGLIIFPACIIYDIQVGAGPSLLFESMATVFNNMEGGRWWGSLSFLYGILSFEFADDFTILGWIKNLF